MNNGFSITFTGQAGFIFESSAGYRVGIDLYLSNCCERYFGFKRLLPFLYDPLNLNLDLLVATHAHYDHFDPDSVPLIIKDCNTKLIAAYDVKAEACKLNLDSSLITYLNVGDVFENEYITIKAMPCDHGKDTPYAIGLLINLDGKKIYITGDTSYREDYFVSHELNSVDVMILPINGAFGNMNEIEAAKAANIVKSKLAIPCHFWNFAEHGGNPYIFMKEIEEKYVGINYVLMRPGETIKI